MTKSRRFGQSMLEAFKILRMYGKKSTARCFICLQIKQEGELAVSGVLEKCFIVYIVREFGFNSNNVIKTMKFLLCVLQTVCIENEGHLITTEEYRLRKVAFLVNSRLDKGKMIEAEFALSPCLV